MSEQKYKLNCLKTYHARCYHMGTSKKHPVPDWVKPSFVIFGIRGLWHSAMSIIVPRCQKLRYKWRLNPVWHRMLYSCYSTVPI